jgi:hypothetical protein
MEALLKVVSEIPCSALHTLTSMVPNDAKWYRVLVPGTRKSHGTKSGAYSGCSNASIYPFLAKNRFTENAAWETALSRYRIPPSKLGQAITLLNALGRRLVRISAGTQAALTKISCISPQSIRANSGTGPELLAAP